MKTMILILFSAMCYAQSSRNLAGAESVAKDMNAIVTRISNENLKKDKAIARLKWINKAYVTVPINYWECIACKGHFSVSSKTELPVIIKNKLSVKNPYLCNKCKSK